MGERRNVYRILVRKSEGKRPFERPRRRWEDGIKMDLRKIGLGGVEWILLAQDRDSWGAVVIAVMNLWVLRHGISFCCCRIYYYVLMWCYPVHCDILSVHATTYL
jgi:hypothetical protein